VDAVEIAAVTTDSPRVMVHLASFRLRSEAEAFARERSGLDRPIYLQSTGEGGWIRVLVGDFDGAEGAQRVAEALLGTGKVRYARPVQVTAAGLERWPGNEAP
jgi:hypothetical protein